KSVSSWNRSSHVLAGDMGFTCQSKPSASNRRRREVESLARCVRWVETQSPSAGFGGHCFGTLQWPNCFLNPLSSAKRLSHHWVLRGDESNSRTASRRVHRLGTRLWPRCLSSATQLPRAGLAGYFGGTLQSPCCLRNARSSWR